MLLILLIAACSLVVSNVEGRKPLCLKRNVTHELWTDENYVMANLTTKAIPFTLSFSLDVQEAIGKPFVRAEMVIMNPSQNHTMINTTIGVCSLLTGKTKNFLLKKLTDKLKSSKTLPKSCPIPPGHYYENDIVLLSDVYPVFVTAGVTRVQVYLYGTVVKKERLLVKAIINSIFKYKVQKKCNN